jgi:hypothetical protein
MNSKKQAREWLDQRCGLTVQVETRIVNSAATPLVNAGPLSRHSEANRQTEGSQEDAPTLWDLYRVGSVSYNLSDLPDQIEVLVHTEPEERLEITFDDGTSLLLTAMITVLRGDDEV